MLSLICHVISSASFFISKPGPSFILFLLALSLKATVHEIAGKSCVPLHVLARSTTYKNFYFGYCCGFFFFFLRLPGT